MNKELWNNISEDYKKARYHLYGKGVPEGMDWKRDDVEGNYYLLKAYRAAKAEQEKNHLVYARILMTMEYQEHGYQDCFEKYKYISEAIREYALATEEDEKPSAEELEYANSELAYNEYMKKAYSNSEESYKRSLSILGMNEENAFNFPDSFVEHFEYSRKNALLVLNFYGERITFEFTGIYDIFIATAPETDYIMDFYCYKDYAIPERLHFDIGLLRIECENIRIVKRL